jgi:hypothetical protein
MKKRVSAKLWNEKRTYDVQLDLQLLELRGQATLPDDHAVEREALAPGFGPVIEDDYTLEYSFNGKQENKKVRVANGTLLSKA